MSNKTVAYRKVDYTKEIAWYERFEAYRRSIKTCYIHEMIENCYHTHLTTLVLTSPSGRVTLYYITVIGNKDNGNIYNKIYPDLQSALDCFRAVVEEGDNSERIPECIATIHGTLGNTLQELMPYELLGNYIARTYTNLPCTEDDMPLSDTEI